MKNMTVTAIAGLVLAVSACGLLGADRDMRGQLTEGDYKFVKEAASGGTSEVELGTLAKQKGTSESVRNFADRMVKDHQKANNELQDIVTKKGAAIPAEVSHGERSTIEHLQKLSGTDFDKAYASAMVKDHKKDVKDFKSAAQNLKDPDLKAFAQNTVPTLEEHLWLAQEVENTIKK
jgi:putative membrane protein